MNVQMLSNMRSVRRYSFLTLQIMRYVTCVILKVSTRRQHRLNGHVLLQAVVDMAEGSLCYHNSKNTKWTFIVLTLRQRYIFVRCIAVLMLEPYNYSNLNMFVCCIAVLMLVVLSVCLQGFGSQRINRD